MKIVIVQGSKVLSPAILIDLPRKGTSIDDILDGGIVVDLQRNSRFEKEVSLSAIVLPEKVTLKREARAPPPLSADVNSESLNAIEYHYYATAPVETTVTSVITPSAPAVL